MKPPLLLNLFVAAVAMASAVAFRAPAEEHQADGPSAAPAALAETKTNNPPRPAPTAPKTRRQEKLAAASLSPAVAEVLKMFDAGVSVEVIETYVENAPIAYEPNGADLIALKQRGAPDDLATALLKKSGEMRERAAQAQSSAVARVYAAANAARVSPDPESYQYFQQNYLYPRTLASAYERLGFYGAPYSYGAYPPLAARPFPSFRYGYPGRF